MTLLIHLKDERPLISVPGLMSGFESSGWVYMALNTPLPLIAYNITLLITSPLNIFTDSPPHQKRYSTISQTKYLTTTHSSSPNNISLIPDPTYPLTLTQHKPHHNGRQMACERVLPPYIHVHSPPRQPRRRNSSNHIDRY